MDWLQAGGKGLDEFQVMYQVCLCNDQKTKGPNLHNSISHVHVLDEANDMGQPKYDFVTGLMYDQGRLLVKFYRLYGGCVKG